MRVTITLHQFICSKTFVLPTSAPAITNGNFKLKLRYESSSMQLIGWILIHRYEIYSKIGAMNINYLQTHVGCNRCENGAVPVMFSSYSIWHSSYPILVSYYVFYYELKQKFSCKSGLLLSWHSGSASGILISSQHVSIVTIVQCKSVKSSPPLLGEQIWSMTSFGHIKKGTF